MSPRAGSLYNPISQVLEQVSWISAFPPSVSRHIFLHSSVSNMCSPPFSSLMATMVLVVGPGASNLILERCIGEYLMRTIDQYGESDLLELLGLLLPFFDPCSSMSSSLYLLLTVHGPWMYCYSGVFIVCETTWGLMWMGGSEEDDWRMGHQQGSWDGHDMLRHGTNYTDNMFYSTWTSHLH